MNPANPIPSRHAVVLFGHGSRDPLWRQPIDAVAARVRAVDPQALVACAFLELTQPDLIAAVDEQVSAGATDVSVVPVFLGVGRHAREDLPLLMERLRQRHPKVAFTLQAAVGEDPRLIDLIAQIALS